MLSIAIGLAVIVAFSAASSEAATLPFSGTLAITFDSFQTLSSTGSSIGTSVGPGGAATIPAGMFSIGAVALVSPPRGGLLGGFAVCAAGLPGNTQLAAPPVNTCAPAPNGSLNAFSFNGTTGTGSPNASAYFTATNFQTVAEIPLSVVGVGGSLTFNVLGLATGTITGNPWQLGVVTVSGAVSGVTTVLTAAGFDNRSVGGTGTLQLVTPALFSLSGGQDSTPTIATLTLNFVPEPGTALLLGSGIASLVVLGRRRLKV
jgi:hypothetical protein